MSKLNGDYTQNATSQIVRVRGFTLSDGSPYTAGVYNTATLVVKAANGSAALASIGTLVTMTVGTWTTLGFKHESNGVYQVGVPNTWLTTAGPLLIAPEGITGVYFVPECVDITPSSVYAAPATTTEIADALLDRNLATGTDSGSPTVRTVRQALRAMRNKVAVASGTATVYKEDDTTASWTATVTGSPAVTVVDPA